MYCIAYMYAYISFAACINIHPLGCYVLAGSNVVIFILLASLQIDATPH